VVWQKIRKPLRILLKFLFNLPGFLLAIPVVLLIRILKPIVLVRFGQFGSEIIGHTIFYLEYYLSKHEGKNSKIIDCFYFPTHDIPDRPNLHWDLMIRKHVRISPIFYYFDKINRFIPGGKMHYIEICFDDYNGLLARTKPHVKFIKGDDERGSQFLETLGLAPDDRYVCLIIRDSAYKEKYQKWDNADWSYHNYRDTDIETYNKTARALAEKGYWVFRMGKAVDKPFMVDHPHVLDYANSFHRSDFLDIWLMANCHFCISTGTGIDMVACVYQRPLVMVNYIPLSAITVFCQAVTVPKKLVWENKERGKLSLQEQLQHNYSRTQEYKDAGIRILDLSPDEITEAVLEIEQRIDSQWNDTEEDIKLQKLFWNQLKAWPGFGNYNEWIHPESRIGASFLRKNHEWFFK